MGTYTYEDFLQYKVRFEAFRTITNEFDNVLSWLHEKKEHLNLDTVKKIISVGAGTGSFDFNFHKLFPLLESYSVIDPNIFHIGEFKKILGNDDRFIYHHAKAEDFVFNQGYDLALISHSLYYINEIQSTLKKVTAHAKSSLIFHQTTYGIHALQQKFGDETTNKYKLSSDEIKNHLNDLTLSYNTWRVDAHLSVKNIENIHIDFILEKETTEDERSEVREYLKATCPEGKLYHPVDIILIR